MPNYTYDAHHTRYELVAENEDRTYNWLFIPGGPGADSSYLYDLVKLLELPGKVWLIDLPGNGNNMEGFPSDYNYNEWFDLFLPIIDRFENPILVGHGFGGTFPLLFPELEEKLKGFVILNGAPTTWFNECLRYMRLYNLPDLTLKIFDFLAHPSEKKFHKLLHKGISFGFTPHTAEIAKALSATVPFRYEPAVWWHLKVFSQTFDAEWVPYQVPTLIVGGRYDSVMPFSLFRSNKHFQRPNIELVYVDNGGHLPWYENPEVIQAAFKKFCEQLE